MYNVKIPEKQIDISCFYTYFHSKKESGHIFSGQRHSFWEMNVILDGSMSLTCDDKIINLQKGQMFLIYPNEFHKFIVTSQESMELLVLTFSMEGEIPYAVYDLSEESMQLINMIINLIEKNGGEKIFNASLQAPQALKLITELLILRAVSCDAVPYIKDRNSDIYESAVKFMNANIFEKITVHDVAKHCNVSDTTLKNLFSRHTKGGVMHYFMELKIEYSKKLLAAGHRVNSIAEELKFSSAAHYSSTFKKVCGTSPLAFKKEIMQEPD